MYSFDYVTDSGEFSYTGGSETQDVADKYLDVLKGTQNQDPTNGSTSGDTTNPPTDTSGGDDTTNPPSGGQSGSTTTPTMNSLDSLKALLSSQTASIGTLQSSLSSERQALTAAQAKARSKGSGSGTKVGSVEQKNINAIRNQITQTQGLLTLAKAAANSTANRIASAQGSQP